MAEAYPKIDTSKIIDKEWHDELFEISSISDPVHDLLRVTPEKLKEIREGTKMNSRFRSSETVERAILDEKEFQYLYDDNNNFILMDQKYSLTFHAQERLIQRSTESPESLINIIIEERYLKIGKELGSNREHLLFFSNSDTAFSTATSM